MRNRFLNAALVGAASIIVISCSDESTGPIQTTDGVVAQVQYTSTRPELYVQDLRGDQKRRITFSGAVDPIPGNSPHVPPLRDENLLALGPLQWSRDGRKLALVATLAHDQSVVVVLDADGSNARIGSINSQIILSDPAWSEDARQIAYAMSTLPLARGVEIFVTDLVDNRVRKLTTNSGFGAFGAALRFRADGREVFYSRSVSSGNAPLFNRTGELLAIDLAAASARTVAANLPGDVNGIARDGSWVLLLRNQGVLPDGSFDRLLVRRDLASGQETVLVATGKIQYAMVLPGDTEVLVVTDVSSNSSTQEYRYSTVPIGGGTPRHLSGVGVATSNVAVHPTARF